MAGLREIQNRIRSIQDTRKITNAMYLISSTKLKKARKELAETEPYFYALQNVIRRIQRHLPNMESPYFEKEGHQSKKTGLLVISGDKGLAGAYNHNIMKMADTFLKDPSREVHLFVIGETGRQFFASQHIPIEENFQYTAQDPTFNRARWIAAERSADSSDDNGCLRGGNSGSQVLQGVYQRVRQRGSGEGYDPGTEKCCRICPHPACKTH